MKLFRACNQSYANKLDGEGARLYGGRWNSPGVPMIYTSSSRSLAILEILVHIGNIDLLPDSHVMLKLDLSESVLVKKVSEDELPTDFRQGESTKDTRRIGDAWVKDCSSLALLVPSVIVPEEFNILINPAHLDSQKITLLKECSFQEFDKRLFRQSFRSSMTPRI